jgi:formyltetrahydrofolate hydrolase
VERSIIQNTEWKPHDKWKRNRMNLGLKINIIDKTKETKEKNLSHSMTQMKETSDLIILLRYMQKHKKENLRPARIPVFEGQHNE